MKRGGYESSKYIEFRILLFSAEKIWQRLSMRISGIYAAGEVESVAYSELIKNFQKIRGYMLDFFVYGFKSRTEYDRKSARSYDNERRRIESWLGDYMSFRQDSAGKSVFLTVDSRSIAHNPLYEAFKAKSFTDKDITIHFYLLDLLSEPS